MFANRSQSVDFKNLNVTPFKKNRIQSSKFYIYLRYSANYHLNCHNFYVFPRAPTFSYVVSKIQTFFDNNQFFTRTMFDFFANLHFINAVIFEIFSIFGTLHVVSKLAETRKSKKNINYLFWNTNKFHSLDFENSNVGN